VADAPPTNTREDSFDLSIGSRHAKSDPDTPNMTRKLHANKASGITRGLAGSDEIARAASTCPENEHLRANRVSRSHVPVVSWRDRLDLGRPAEPLPGALNSAVRVEHRQEHGPGHGIALAHVGGRREEVLAEQLPPSGPPADRREIRQQDVHSAQTPIEKRR